MVERHDVSGAASGYWRAATGAFRSGEEYVMGRIVVGTVTLAMGRQGEPLRYQASVLLPGIQMKAGTDKLPSVDEAKRRVERAVATWFLWVNETSDSDRNPEGDA